MLVYELWEGVSGNMMAAFDSEAEALAAVDRRATRYGPQSVDSLSLVAVDAEDEDADIVEVASGADLLRRASPPEPALRPATTGVPLRNLRVGELQAPTMRDIVKGAGHADPMHFSEVLKASGIIESLNSFDALKAASIAGTFDKLAVVKGIADMMPQTSMALDAVRPFIDKHFLAKSSVIESMLALQKADWVATTGHWIVFDSLQDQLQTIADHWKTEQVSHLQPILAAMRNSLVHQDIPSLHGAAAMFTACRYRYPSGLQEAIRAATWDAFDSQTRVLLNMPGAEFVTQWETGTMLERTPPRERPKVVALAAVIPLVKKAA